MRTYLDTFIDMKLSECEEALAVIDLRIDSIESKLLSNLNEAKHLSYLSDLSEEYSELITEKERLINSHTRLISVLTRRNMEAFINDSDNQRQE